MAVNDPGDPAQPQSLHRPIDTLFPCLAVVLGETGKFFRNPALHDAKHLNYTKGKLNKLITGANQEFQDALDEIEIEILKAKAVMERDLALIRTKRAERERVAAGLKTHSPVNEEDISPAVNESTEAMQTDSGDILAKESEKVASEDVIMTNGQSDSVGLEETAIGTGDGQALVIDRDAQRAKHQADTAVDDAVKLAVSLEPTETAAEQTNPNPIGEETTIQPGHSSESPTVPDFEDVNFESMFNDNATAADNDQMDFNLGFTNDTNTDQDFLNDSAFENMAMSNEDIKNLNTTSNEDLNTLLPGLENYVNAGDDFSLTDIPPPNPTTLPTTTNIIATAAPAATAPVEQAPIESNFDDFFASGNYMDGGGDDDMGADGGFGDFDDSWFGTECSKPDGS